MRIKVTEFNRNNNQTVFETLLGRGKGIWMDETPPKLGDSYDVELEISDSLSWEENVILVEEENEVIEYDSKYLTIQGKVESVDEDELVVIRLGDSILMIDGFIKPPPVGSFVRLKAMSVQLFNNNV